MADRPMSCHPIWFQRRGAKRIASNKLDLALMAAKNRLHNWKFILPREFQVKNARFNQHSWRLPVNNSAFISIRNIRY
jgi:hypothetical protein